MLILAQAQNTTLSDRESALLFAVLIFEIVVTIAMFAGGGYVMLSWPRGRPGRFLAGAILMFLSLLGFLLAGVEIVTDGYVQVSAPLLVLAGWAMWLAIYIYSRIVIRRHQKAENAEWGTPKRYIPFNQPYSGGAYFEPLEEAEVAPEFPVDPAEQPVVARCTACMGRWRTTAIAAESLETCPKCGDSPPQLRMQRA